MNLGENENNSKSIQDYAGKTVDIEKLRQKTKPCAAVICVNARGDEIGPWNYNPD